MHIDEDLKARLVADLARCEEHAAMLGGLLGPLAARGDFGDMEWVDARDFARSGLDALALREALR